MRLTNLRRPRLSYANVASTLALVIATSTGGAYAAARIGAADIKDDAVRSRHLLGGTVGTTDLRDGAVSRAKLGAGIAAPRAYGTIMYQGEVANARNLASANVTHPATGVYCIHGLSFEPRIALANSALEPNSFHHDIEIYGFAGNFADLAPCPATTQIQVRVYAPGTTTESDGNFNIAIF